MSQLLDRLAAADKIPSPPGVALEIVRLNQDENVDIEELAEVVAQDPAIVAKLFKMANSPVFGRPGQIIEVRQAIITLGLRSVNLLALSFSVVSVSSGSSKLAFDYPSFWTSTAVGSTAARILTEAHFREARSEAFLAGLLGNFAQLVLAECAPEEYGPVLARRGKGESLVELEREILGTDHAILGGELLARWGLPEAITRAIGAHHAPELLDDEAPEIARLARILQMADLCADIYVEADMGRGPSQLLQLGHDHFDMDPEACRDLLQGVEEHTPEIVNLLELDCSDPVKMAEIRAQATEQLVRESLALDQQMHAVSTSVERLEQEKSQLEERATSDPLTGLRNRGYFDQCLAGSLEHAHASGGSLGLLLIDIDLFKSVNDSYGHVCGDEMLRQVARAVQGAAPDTDTVCRYGGEEFAVICPDTTLAELEARAEQLRAAVEGVTVEAGSDTVRRTISVGGGLVEAPGSAEGGAALIEAADTELYRAKSEGRNRCFTTRVKL